MPNRSYQYLTFLHAHLTTDGASQLNAPDLAVLEPGTTDPSHIRLNVLLDIVFGGHSSHITQHFLSIREDACESVLRGERKLIDEAGNIYRLGICHDLIQGQLQRMGTHASWIYRSSEQLCSTDAHGMAYSCYRTMFHRALDWSHR